MSHANGKGVTMKLSEHSSRLFRSYSSLSRLTNWIEYIRRRLRLRYSLLDRLPGDETPAPDTWLLAESVRLDIERALRRLTPREAEIVRLYYGLGREHPQTLDAIGQRFGLSRERVRQIKKEALCKLRRKYRHRRGLMLN